jgi:Fe-S-cluster containining protein
MFRPGKILVRVKRFLPIRHYPSVISSWVANSRFSWVISGFWFPMDSGSRRKSHTAGGKGGRFQRLEPVSGSVASGDSGFREVPCLCPRTLIRSPIRLYHSEIAMQRDFPASDDRALIQIVDSALADVARRSGEWLVCRPGCTQCCMGAFPINQLDAARLRTGLAKLEGSAPARAEGVRARARDAVARLSPDFPGDPVSGLLDEGYDASRRFSDFANDEPCPALDPATGNCELYESRPMTCRVFGPPVRSEDGLGVCELCFHGATDKEIAACEMKPDPDDREQALLEKLEKATGTRGNTIIAFCLAS